MAALLSTARLREIAAYLFDAPTPADDRRSSARMATAETVRVRPFDGEAFDVAVRDISREGVALVADRPIEEGTQFTLHLAEVGDVLATVRHVREERGRYVIGARFGTDWLGTMAAAMRPAKPASLTDADARPRRRVDSRVT